jgi:hypothetical protein
VYPNSWMKRTSMPPLPSRADAPSGPDQREAAVAEGAAASYARTV